jgi:predicted ABC-type ATPase
MVPKHTPFQPELKIIYGPPGSGKNKLISILRLNNCFTSYMDYDKMIYSNKEFQSRLTDSNSQELYLEFRKKIRKIDNEYHEKAIKTRTHILWQTTGNNIDYYNQWFARLRKIGYKITVYFVFVPSHFLYARINNRHSQVNVPLEQIQKYWETSYNNALKVVDMVDNVRMFGNVHQMKRIRKVEPKYLIRILLKRNMLLHDKSTMSPDKCVHCYRKSCVRNYLMYCQSLAHKEHVKKVLKRQANQIAKNNQYDPQNRVSYMTF